MDFFNPRDGYTMSTTGARELTRQNPLQNTIVYLDDLLTSLKSLGISCHWDGLFVGAVCYVDDIALLAPSPSALRLMLKHREEFAISRGLSFKASKSQLIHFVLSLHICVQLKYYSSVSHYRLLTLLLT